MPFQHATRRGPLGESYCIFARGDRELAVPVSAAREVLSGQMVLPEPDAPPHVVGRLELRGDSLPVVCVDSWLNLPEREYDLTDQILVLQAGEYRAGVVVDRVRDVRRIGANEIHRDETDATDGPFFAGYWESEGRRIAVIDGPRCIGELRQTFPGWKPQANPDTALRKRQRGEDYCIFTRAHRNLAMPVSVAREVLTGESIVPVPQAPPHVMGVLNLRGDVLPLVQVDSWLELPPRPYGVMDQILVVTSKDVTVGVVVDRVRDVRNVEAHEILPSVGMEGLPFVGRLESVDGEIMVMDADRLLTEVVVLAETGFQGALGRLGVGGGESITGVENV